MNMREKIARAMYERNRRKVDGTLCDRPWTEAHGAVRQFHLDSADAMLDAMMEPTEEMCAVAGQYGVGDNGKRAAAHLSRMTFTTMIQAAKDGK